MIKQERDERKVYRKSFERLKRESDERTRLLIHAREQELLEQGAGDRREKHEAYQSLCILKGREFADSVYPLRRFL